MDQDSGQNELSPKQQAVERLKGATNVLVTVNANPSVDQLAAAIGLTLMLNKMGKHATAVFSGQVPSTIEFLKPEETIEQNTDSLRDFIVSLDKSKADKLRYKVEENVVRIYITPYRTSLSEKDLEFSQGDFNVDAVVALGVSQREDLDQAIIAHGRILHDATVITVSAGQADSQLGMINWQDPAASSLSEMIVSISEAFQGGLIDGQMATAFLTGIVAETERFRNPKTTPKVMTMSAQLMAAGANQQLIAEELEKTQPLTEEPVAIQQEIPAPAEPPKEDDGALEIQHEEEQPAPEPEPEPEPVDDSLIHIDNDGNLKKQWEVDQEAKKQSEETAQPPEHKVIEPLNQEPKQEPKTDLQHFDFEAPENASPINAAMPEQPPEQAVNPLMPPTSSPQPDQGPHSTEDNVSGLDLPPVPEGGDTLLDIEKSVHSPHLSTLPPAPGPAPQPAPEPAQAPEPPHEDNARNAVMDALSTTGEQEKPAAFNALPLGGALHNQLPDSTGIDSAPAPGAPLPTMDHHVPDLTPPPPPPNLNDLLAGQSSNSDTPQFPLPGTQAVPTPQVPGGMPLHDLGETVQEDGPPPPPVPPPLPLG